MFARLVRVSCSFQACRGESVKYQTSSAFKSPLRPSAAAATASVPDTSRETESEMEISMTSDVTHQLSTTSPSRQPAAVATTSAEDLVLDQFQ